MDILAYYRNSDKKIIDYKSHIYCFSIVYIVKGLSKEAEAEQGGVAVSDQEFNRIVGQYADIVYRVALSYTGAPQDAEDVVQTTFMKLLTGNREFRDEEHIRRWLIRVTVNECNSLWSSFWRRNVEYSDVPATEPEFSIEERQDLYQAVMNLPAKCRIVVHLFYYEDYSSKEIAAILHMREATVRTRLVRARKLLRQQLKDAWEDEEKRKLSGKLRRGTFPWGIAWKGQGYEDGRKEDPEEE